MPVGDVVSTISSIAAGAYLDIQPGSGIEWVIHNIHHEDQVEIYFYDGTNSILVDVDAGQGSWTGQFFHCTNTKYYRVKNTAASAKLIGYDGIITKTT